MRPIIALVQFSFDSQHYSFSTDIAYFDGVPVQISDFDKVLGVVFFPNGDRVLHVEKEGESYLFQERLSLLSPIIHPSP